MYDNKVRLSADVMEKAQAIAEEWGLKNARAAVEAVFRRYADEYLYGRMPTSIVAPPRSLAVVPQTQAAPAQCDALDELDDLLGA